MTFGLTNLEESAMRKITWCSRPALFAVLVLALSACGTNPVTGKKEIQFVSEASELQIGATHYAPSRQSQGGDFKLLPELSAYVSEVGQKLAAVSDRPLPYEFVVLNSSTPNAWALPGGKIAINRGLLTTLENEAELAAVLGHEIVHAAARHGAKAQERGTLLQVGMVAAQIGVMTSDVDSNLGNLLVSGAGVGAQLISTRYGREAELEADLYGMRYMRAAGYDPAAAISLQQKFLALSQKDGRAQASWLEGLFASHPPSAERVDRNQATSGSLGPGGDLGAERYRSRVAPLLAMKPAYDKADAASEAAAKKDLPRARALAAEAVAALPREARFHQLQGDLAVADKQYNDALGHYRRSIELDSEYFAAHLGAGVASYRAGDRGAARAALERSVKLLPTAPAYYYLGSIARDSGDTQQALALFKEAAGSGSDVGKRAAAEFVRLDLPRNPGQYIATAPRQGGRGQVIAVLQNRAPIALSAVALTPVLLDASGRVVREGRTLQINQRLEPGAQLAVDAGVGTVDPAQLGAVRFRIDGARAAE
jgi:beta-barrel assembly-enhancing protease